MRQGFVGLIPMVRAYTYERCSLTTAGVVTGATTNMYVLFVSLFLFFLLVYGGKCRHIVGICKENLSFFICPDVFSLKRCILAADIHY